MGIISNLFKLFIEEEEVYDTQPLPPRLWHGVPIEALNSLAKEVYHGVRAYEDSFGFLVFDYTSRSGKTTNHSQCNLDENKKLKKVTDRIYENQWRSSADDFVREANNRFTFE